MELLQVASELAPVIAIYREMQPKRVLEIGCWDGGTLQLWLQDAAPECVVAVDLEHRNRDAYEAWRAPGTELIVQTGSSKDADQVAAMRAHGPYDWALIDGDHSDEYVRSDVSVVLPLMRAGGVMVLHDITPPAGFDTYAPGVVLDELERDGYRVDRFQDGKIEPWAHGMGLVWC